MMNDMRRRKTEPTLLPTQDMRGSGLWRHCKLLYTMGKCITAQLNVIAVTGSVPLSPGSPTQCLNQLNYLLTTRVMEDRNWIQEGCWKPSHVKGTRKYYVLLWKNFLHLVMIGNRKRLVGMSDWKVNKLKRISSLNRLSGWTLTDTESTLSPDSVIINKKSKQNGEKGEKG